jgi:hypothetical protein
MASKLKALTGAFLATAMTAGAVAPASAQWRGDRYDRYDRRHDGISAGEVIAGAVIIGGLAAILSSGNRDRGRYDRYDRYDRGYDRYNDRRYDDRRDYDWQRYGGSRSAIDRCVRAVEQRGGRRDDVDVTRITYVDRIRDGYRINGDVAVDYRGGYRGDQYDRGYNRRGYDDRGSFSCTVRYGQIDDLRVRGI